MIRNFHLRRIYIPNATFTCVFPACLNILGRKQVGLLYNCPQYALLCFTFEVTTVLCHPIHSWRQQIFIICALCARHCHRLCPQKILPPRILRLNGEKAKEASSYGEFLGRQVKTQVHRASRQKEQLVQAWETRKVFAKMTMKLCPKKESNLIRQITRDGTFR